MNNPSITKLELSSFLHASKCTSQATTKGFIVLLSINNVNGKDIPRPCIGNSFQQLQILIKNVEKWTKKDIYIYIKDKCAYKDDIKYT